MRDTGLAIGVTVRTDPSNPLISSCIDQEVRRMSFPDSPQMDLTRTRF